MFTIFLSIHSLIRYVILLLLLITLFKSITGWLGKKNYTSEDSQLALFSVLALHLQLLIGLMLYMMSPIVQSGLADFGNAMKQTDVRFWTVEHVIAMVLSVIIITIGRWRSKKSKIDWKKHKKIAIFFLIGFLLIVSSIPWPFSSISRAWF